MKETLKKLRISFPVIIMLALSFTLSSCTDEDDPYYSPLVGDWGLVDYVGPGNFFLNGLSLYSDGSGYVTGYNDYGALDGWEVWWATYAGSTFQITFTDGYGDIWSYYYDFNNGELHLVPVEDPSTEYWFAR